MVSRLAGRNGRVARAVPFASRTASDTWRGHGVPSLVVRCNVRDANARRRVRRLRPPATMSALGQHLMLRFTDDRIMTPSIESRCAFARTVLRIGRPFGLLFFAAAGTHSHTVLIATKSEESGWSFATPSIGHAGAARGSSRPARPDR